MYNVNSENTLPENENTYVRGYLHKIKFCSRFFRFNITY